MITATQIVTHIIGDYFFQSDWMAVNKSKHWLPCIVHCLIYTLVFAILFTPTWIALGFIFCTHYLLDRFSLTRYLVWAKNFMNPTDSNHRFADCRFTGFYDKLGQCNTIGDPDGARPFYLTLFLYIVMDNTLHIICNGFALTYLN